MKRGSLLNNNKLAVLHLYFHGVFTAVRNKLEMPKVI